MSQFLSAIRIYGIVAGCFVAGAAWIYGISWLGQLLGFSEAASAAAAAVVMVAVFFVYALPWLRKFGDDGGPPEYW